MPTPAALAAVSDDALNKLWQGLGYYSRARSLKKAAIEIVGKYGGSLPRTYEELRSLCGIGPYTAGAIASIAYGLPTPAVDGNVLRVYTRLLADDRDISKQSTKDVVTAALAAIYPSGEDASNFTQALMELGATVCVPNGAPHCDTCPVAELCRAHTLQSEQSYPHKPPKKARRIEEHTVLLLRCGDKYAIRKRGEEGLLAGLWEFPSVKGHVCAKDALAAFGITQAAHIEPTPPAKHIFTHIEWHMQGYYVALAKEIPDLLFVTKEEIEGRYSIPSAFKAFLALL